MFAKGIENVLLRLRPDFSEKVMEVHLCKLFSKLSNKYGVFNVESRNNNVVVSLKREVGKAAVLTKDNWVVAFKEYS